MGLANLHMSNNILVIAPSWIGDIIMSQSLYRGLKYAHKKCQIDVYAPKWSLPVLDRMAEVDNAYELPFAHRQLKLMERYKLGKRIGLNCYSQAIILPGSFKSALVPFFAKIPIRTGYKGEQRYLMLNDIRKPDIQHFPLLAERYLHLGTPAQNPLSSAKLKPKLTVNKNNLQKLLQKFHLETDKNPIAVLCPGAEYGPAKRWPHYHYASLADKLIENGWQVWLMGSDKDTDACNQIIAKISSQSRPLIKQLAGKTQLIDAIDLISASTVCVSNDSGLMHMASALNIGLVALFGPTEPRETPPLNDNSKIIDLKYPKEKVRRGPCEYGYHPSLTSISPEQVLDAIDSVIKKAKQP